MLFTGVWNGVCGGGGGGLKASETCVPNEYAIWFLDLNKPTLFHRLKSFIEISTKYHTV